MTAKLMKELGRARASVRNRVALFEDPAWDDRFDALIRLTQRTNLILDLIGAKDISARRLKQHIDRRLEEFGLQPARPRGVGQSYKSTLFLETKFDRFDAAYLLALHFGTRGPGEFSEPEPSLGRALDKMLESYLRYRSDLYPGNTQAARVEFETYWILLQGIRKGDIELVTCKDCGSRHPVLADSVSAHSCPACGVLDLRMKEARATFDKRLREHRDKRERMREELRHG